MTERAYSSFPPQNSHPVENHSRSMESRQSHDFTPVSARLDIMQSMLDELRRQAVSQEQLSVVQAEQDERLKTLESQVEPDPQLYAITGWANLRGVKMADMDYGRFGQFAAKIARDRRIALSSRRHSVYGRVNTYPLDFLDETYEVWQRKD